MSLRTVHQLKSLARTELLDFVTENVGTLSEQEALSILANPYCGAPVCQAIARDQRLTSFYSVRNRLVAHRATPLTHAVKLIHYLYWPDLLRISVEVTVPSAVRRAIDTLLVLKIINLSAGEKISSAKRCSPALIKVFLFDHDPRIFASLLLNQRLREEDLVLLANSPRAATTQLRMIADDYKWSHRYAIRKALAMNPLTPRATAASQLRFLSRRDLLMIHGRPGTSVYLRRCIERLHQSDFSDEG